MTVRLAEYFDRQAVVYRTITSPRAGRNRTDSVDFCVKLDVVAFFCGGILVKESMVVVDAGRHEDIEGIMNIVVREAYLSKRRFHVRIAIGHVALSRAQLPSPFAASRVNQIVRHRVVRELRLLDGIRDKGEHRTHVRFRAPQPTADLAMRSM